MFSCSVCSASDPTSDTIKVSLGSLTALPQGPSAEEQARQRAEEQRLADEAEAERQREAGRRQAEAAERRRQEEEATLRRLREEEATAKRVEEARLEQEHRAAEAAELAKRLEKEREEQERLQREADEAAKQARCAQEAQDRKLLQTFLKKHAFKGPDAKRSNLLGYKYPLHSAVKHKDVEVIRILLANGASLTSKDSSGCTPVQLAQKMNKAGSHGDVIQALAVVN
eukprot:TRINITY_DN13150_c0_g1_i2.p1 TRINITY_DN13150_c0_g1~~TRINITY_DN13150_c0_g1_i2.p1  ORF type:complete len:227 (-),score=66.10 TRINITY_DN13150_c0_g1_i2:313-993(-)